MLKAEYMLFLAARKVDQKGRMDLIGVCDSVFVASVPVKIDGLKVALRLFSQGDDLINQSVDLSVVVRRAGKEVSRVQLQDKISTSKNEGFSPAFDLSSVIFPSFGKYDVTFAVDDQDVITRWFEVAQEQPGRTVKA